MKIGKIRANKALHRTATPLRSIAPPVSLVVIWQKGVYSFIIEYQSYLSRGFHEI